MRFHGEMRVQGSGPLDGPRFDALAYALAGIEETDPSVADMDLTASLAQGRVVASMVIDAETVDFAVRKLIAVVRVAAAQAGDRDSAHGWHFLVNRAGLSVQPVIEDAGAARSVGNGSETARDHTSPAAPAPVAAGPAGPAPVGPAPVGTAPVGTAPVGTAPVGARSATASPAGARSEAAQPHRLESGPFAPGRPVPPWPAPGPQIPVPSSAAPSPAAPSPAAPSAAGPAATRGRPPQVRRPARSGSLVARDPAGRQPGTRDRASRDPRTWTPHHSHRSTRPGPPARGELTARSPLTGSRPLPVPGLLRSVAAYGRHWRHIISSSHDHE